MSFDSEGITCAGVLYRPDGHEPTVPCVVMAHGFSGMMDWIVPDFAARFASGGLAVLIFDYRHVIAHAVDDPQIAAVVANVPALDLYTGIRGRAEHQTDQSLADPARRRKPDGSGDGRRGSRGAEDVTALHQGVRPPRRGRLQRSFTGRSFPRVRELSAHMAEPVHPRFFFTAPRYRQGTMERLRCPLLVTLARDDDVISSAFVKEKAPKAPVHEIREYPMRHFDMYHGAVRDQVASDQLAFLRRHLL